MPSARLNFVDHPDGSFSCQAIFSPDGYDPASMAHQACRILDEFVGSIRQEAPEDGTQEWDEANRPTQDTEAYMHFTDVDLAFRLNLQYLPKSRGFVQGSPAHEACMRAHARLEFLHQAVSDAVLKRTVQETPVMVSRQKINELNGNG